jgi:hypothetical protein
MEGATERNSAGGALSSVADIVATAIQLLLLVSLCTLVVIVVVGVVASARRRNLVEIDMALRAAALLAINASRSFRCCSSSQTICNFFSNGNGCPRCRFIATSNCCAQPMNIDHRFNGFALPSDNTAQLLFERNDNFDPSSFLD